ncbi:MAG: hypothetical protein AABZ10_15280 [Nitrospirota bacterium]
MITLQNKIAACFGGNQVPTRNELIKQDGVDPFLKEDAEKAFLCQSWSDLFKHLKTLKDAVQGADYRLEEWSILEPSALNYYLRAYLDYLLEILTQNEPDEEFVSFLFHNLYQAVYIHKRGAFDEDQKEALREVAAHTVKTIKNHKGFEIWKHDIDNNIDMFLAELKKYS